MPPTTTPLTLDPPPLPPLNFKILLMGSSAVGKSSLLLRFTDGEWLAEEETSATIGVDFKVKKLVVDERAVKLSVWDTAGQERFRTITTSYYRGAQGVALVYDTSSRPSFLSLPTWHRELLTYCSPHTCILLIGNKTDKEFQRQVSAKEGEEYARSLETGGRKVGFVEVSAKEGRGVAEGFEGLVRQIIATPELWSTDPKLLPTRDPSSFRPAPTTGNVHVRRDDGGGEELGGCAC